MGLFSRAKKGTPEEREAARQLRSKAFLVESGFHSAMSEQRRSEVVLILGGGLGEFYVDFEKFMETMQPLPPSEFRDKAMAEAVVKMAQINKTALAVAAKKGVLEDEVYSEARTVSDSYRKRISRD